MTSLSEEIRRKRWRWTGHVLRKDTDNNSFIAMTWAPEGKRKIGRPKTTWRRTVEKERGEMGWSSWHQARTVAKDRDRWRCCIEALCANRREEVK